MLRILCIFIFLGIHIVYSASRTCQTFNKVPMLLYDRNGNKFNRTVHGCIQRIEFGNTTVIKAYAKEQRISHLGRDTVRNMKYLTTVSFDKCEVEDISPVAFRNVPNLSTVEISQGKLKEIVRGIFTFELTPELQTLLINNNEIDFIEDGAFYNLTKLRKIDVNHNLLKIWRPEWFENATSLESMNFQFNHIRAIPRRAFQNFPNLREIYFDHNNITKIDEDAFKKITTLDYVGLSHNKLTILEAHSFPNTVRIKTLAIGANYLNFLSDEVLKRLAVLEIVMDYNPWKCTCLDRINYWLYIKNGKSSLPNICSGKQIPICATPKGSSEACVDGVDSELTHKYIHALKNLSVPVDPNCAKLEYEL